MPVRSDRTVFQRRELRVVTDGEVANSHLLAAESILAHQNWLRMKCGSGLSITIACATTEHFKLFAADDAGADAMIEKIGS